MTPQRQSGDTTRRLRLVVAARPSDLSPGIAHAINNHRIRVVKALAERFDVALVFLRSNHDDDVVDTKLDGLEREEVRYEEVGLTRGIRVKHVLQWARRAALAPWERELADTAHGHDPDVVIALGPWLGIEYRALFMTWPSIYVYDEDVAKMRGYQKRSVGARIFAGLEQRAKRRAGMTPTVVTVLAEQEILPARERFPRSAVEFVPFTLDNQEWPLAPGTSDGRSILVVGDFRRPRNTAGLVPILQEIRARDAGFPWTLVIVSGAGVDAAIEPYLSESWLRLATPDVDLYRAYREARGALVPAVNASGFKSTILQAWVTGCPVVASNSSAITVGHDERHALVSASEPGELVDLMRKTFSDDDARARLAAAGLSVARGRHQQALEIEILAELVEHIAPGDAAPSPDSSRV